MPEGLVVGFDFGLKRIGVAVGQTITQTAKPLTVVNAQNDHLLWQTLDKLMQQWQPQLLVVGLPLNMDGSAQPITRATKNFANKLKQRYTLPVHFADERLSTKEARAQIFAERGFKGLQQQSVDSIAAALILEQWLAENY